MSSSTVLRELQRDFEAKSNDLSKLQKGMYFFFFKKKLYGISIYTQILGYRWLDWFWCLWEINGVCVISKMGSHMLDFL